MAILRQGNDIGKGITWVELY